MTRKAVVSSLAAVALGGTAFLATSAQADTAPDVAAKTATAATDAGTTKKDQKEGDTGDHKQNLIERIRAELQELVDDGTITAEQADAIAEVLAAKVGERGPKPPGEGGERPKKPGDDTDRPQPPGNDKQPPSEGDRPERPGGDAPSSQEGAS